ncbi:Hypothetical predicted protein, partial [Octopus vulgaris]
LKKQKRNDYSSQTATKSSIIIQISLVFSSNLRSVSYCITYRNPEHLSFSKITTTTRTKYYPLIIQ